VNEDNGPEGEQNDDEEPDFEKAAEEAIKKAKLRTLEGAENDENERSAARDQFDDLVERGRQIFSSGAVRYPNVKPIAGGIMTEAKPTDPNRWAAFDALFGDGKKRPHVDTFRGRLVDHRGEIIDDHYPMVELTRALDGMGLRGHSASEVQKAFRQWSLMVKRNDLAERFENVIPVWDGQPRMMTSLIDMFECNDGDLNREFSVYFWLSMYNRITNPGCFAPMVLCLLGGQFTGKSHFANIVCQAILGKPEAHAVKLDLAKDWTPFLRQITGHSIIANVGEMTGYRTAELTRIKDFITSETDPFDYKYEGHIDQQRQWIIVMNGNSYDGLQRDETGNRRFYPMFVGEKHVGALETLQSKWTPEYCAGIAATIWPIMAECREWMRVNGGFNGYLKMVTEVAKKVFDFNKNEMENDRGTIRDDDLDIFFIPALENCEVRVLNHHKNKGIWIASDEISNKVWEKSHRTYKLKKNHLVPKMKALGAEWEQIKNKAGYIFRDVMNYDDFLKILHGEETDEAIEKDKIIDPNVASGPNASPNFR
jgi:Virulence-associated protein E